MAQLGWSLRSRQPCSAPIELAWAECWCHLGPPTPGSRLTSVWLVPYPIACLSGFLPRDSAASTQARSSVSFWASSAAWLASRTGQRVKRFPLWVLSEQDYEYITRAGTKSRSVMMSMSCLDGLVYNGLQHESWMLVV